MFVIALNHTLAPHTSSGGKWLFGHFPSLEQGLAVGCGPELHTIILWIYIIFTTSKQKHSLRESWWNIGFDYDIGGAKSKETRSYQKGKCHSPIFSTFLGHVLFVC